MVCVFYFFNPPSPFPLINSQDGMARHGMAWHGMVWYGIKFVSSETNGRPGLSFHFFFSFIRTIKHFLSPLKPPLYHLFTLFHQIRIKLANKSFSIFHYLAHLPLFRTFDPFVQWIWGESRKLAALGRICVLRDALIPGARVSNGNILPHYLVEVVVLEKEVDEEENVEVE